jgi:hypothetical protein
MPQPAVTEAGEPHSLDGVLAALRQRIARWTDQEGLLMTALPGVALARRDAPTPPMAGEGRHTACASRSPGRMPPRANAPC